MKRNLGLIMLLGAALFATGCFKKSTPPSAPGITSDASQDTNSDTTQDGQLLQFSEIKQGEEIATIKTNYGEIKVRFFPEQAPKAVENFLKHAKEGYYDNTTFHRVIKDFMIQGGDPEGTGMGGESIWGEPFENEIAVPELHHFRGALSMANQGTNPETGEEVVSNGSQFFIVQNNQLSQEYKDMMEQIKQVQDEVSNPETGEKYKDIFPTQVCDEYLANGGTPFLDTYHTVFGQVFEGLDVVDAIADAEVNPLDDKPVQEVMIESIQVSKYK